MSTTRRHMIRSLAASGLLLPGFLSQLMAEDGPANRNDPLAPKPTHFAPKAKRVIFLFMTGGVSHVDTFDPKPVLKPWLCLPRSSDVVRSSNRQGPTAAGIMLVFIVRGWPVAASVAGWSMAAATSWEIELPITR